MADSLSTRPRHIWRAFALSALAAIAFGGCSSGLSPTGAGGAASMQAGKWSFDYSPNMPSHPSDAGTGWQFVFPTQDGVHYLTTSQQPSTTDESITATIAVSTTGNPIFDYHTEADNTCDSPAKVRLYFQRNGDNLTGQGDYQYYRWWSASGAYVLGPGTITITGDLSDPSQWSSVFGAKGDSNPQMFRAALADLANIGFTFGGGCFYGHGVYIDANSGQATFKALSYVVR